MKSTFLASVPGASLLSVASQVMRPPLRQYNHAALLIDLKKSLAIQLEQYPFAGRGIVLDVICGDRV
jgi:hypothetical protein